MDTELTAKDYIGQPVGIRQGQAFKKWNRLGFTSIKVLEFLDGKPWDDVALGYVHALRPSHIRVTEGMVQCDAQQWRVTVFVKEGTNIIESISQEITVGLPEKVVHGGALRDALMYGIDSPQVEWHALECQTECFGIGGHRKIGLNGESITYPKIVKKHVKRVKIHN